jgi:hypothetical protein
MFNGRISISPLHHAGGRRRSRSLLAVCITSDARLLSHWALVLAGSVSNDAAEVGWASAYDPGRFLPGRSAKGVVYGEDRPPALPLPELGATLRKAVGGGPGR